MPSMYDEIHAAWQQNASSDALLELLLQNGAAAEVAQHIRASEVPQDHARLLERCFQALRKGALSGVPNSNEGDADADEDAEHGPQPQLQRAAAALFKAGISVLAGDGDESQLGTYTSTLLDNLDLLKFHQLAALLSDICRGVEGGSSGTPRLLQLLAPAATRLLEMGTPEDEAEEEGGAGADAGATGRGGRIAAARHVDTALHRVTHADWISERGSYAVQIMEALREVPMTPQQLHSVVVKSLSVCSGCSDLAALPSLLRQLLRMAGLGQRALVLRGVLALFSRLEAQHRSAADGLGRPSQALQNVEGTALVIIADAFKYDSALAEELLRSVRSSAVTPSPFCLLLLFTLARQHKLDGQVVALLRAMVVAAFEWDSTRSRSAWLSSLPQLPRPGGQQLGAALLRAVRYSGVGGEVVIPGILALGAALMAGCPSTEALTLVQLNDTALAAAEAEAAAAAEGRRAGRRGKQQLPQQQQQQEQLGPGHAGGGSGSAAAKHATATTSRPEPTASSAPRELRGSAALQGALLGIQLLQAAFEAHREARIEVLRLCQQALGGAAGAVTAGMGGGGPPQGLGLGRAAGQELVLPAVILLSNLAARHPALLYEHTARLKDAFQSFLLLPAPAALGLLLGLWPLARNRRDLADHLVMLLRKVMFAREAASRLVAVRGFLFILLQQLRASAGGGSVAEDTEQLAAATAAAAAAAGPSFSQASCSQSSLSQMQALASGPGVSLQHELQGFLRRALGQQAAVRAALYDGLSEIILVDPGSRDVVLELVAPQFYRYVADGAVMPPLNCKLLVGGGNSTEQVVLLEPLPALLACVRRLVALCRDPWVSDGGPGGGGGAGEGLRHRGLGLLAADDDGGDVMVVDDGEEGVEVQGADVEVQGLVRAWDGFARRLIRCEAEHFDLYTATDLNPATPNGVAKQLQASCLMGVLEVVMEELVAIATGPRGSETAARTGELLNRVFELHCRVYDLAREAKAPGGGSRTKRAVTEAPAGSGGDGSGGTAATAANGGTAPQGGGGGVKRPREASALRCPDMVPVELRAPAMSPGCLAKLCNGVLRDGLAVEATDAEAGPSAHTRLARSPIFQAFTLRSCLNGLLTASVASPAALTDALVAAAARRQRRAAAREAATAVATAGQSGGGGVDGNGRDGLEAPWKPMARPLMLLCQTVLTTWSGVAKRPATARRGPGGGGAAGGGPAAAAAAAAARRQASAADSIAALAVSCMRELLAVTTALGGLDAVAWVLRGLPIHSQDTQAQVDEQDLPPEDILLARLPHFADMLTRLMATCSFKEATSLVEVVVAVARLLPLHAQGAVSDTCWELMHQTEPQVTHTGLVRALVAAYATLRGKAELEALLNVSRNVQEVVGKAGSETQQEVSAPGALHEGTAQLAALEVLRLLEGHLAQGEELLNAVVVVGGGGAAGATVAAATAAAAAAAVAAAPEGRSDASGAAGGGSRGGTAGACAATARSVSEQLELLCRRLLEVVGVLQVVVQTRLGNPQVLEAQVEVLIRGYRLLGAVAKAHLPAKGIAAAAAAAAAGAAPAPPPPALGRAFQELVSRIHLDLTPPVYTAVGDDLSAPGAPAGVGEDGAAGAAASRLSRAKLKRDAKAYSQLVHAIEDWEKHLLALEKVFKARGVNLMRGAKRSTNRDFMFVGSATAAAAGGG